MIEKRREKHLQPKGCRKSLPGPKIVSSGGTRCTPDSLRIRSTECQGNITWEKGRDDRKKEGLERRARLKKE